MTGAKVLKRLQELVDETLDSESVFENEEALSIDYIPKSLPGREKQVRELAINFRPLLANPGKNSIRVVASGKPGTGKTITLRKFGEIFSQKAKERGVRVIYTHVNCYRQRTLFLVLTEIARQMNLHIPNRGLSSQEVFRAIYEYLEKRNLHLIVSLDEFDYFVNSVLPEDIYFLVRVYDELNINERRIHYAFVVKDLNPLTSLEPNIKEHILKSVIEFPPYTSSELYEILKERAKEAFKQNAVTEEAISFIAETHGVDKGGSGNARIALEILELAGKIADSQKSPIVTVEHVKLAAKNINPQLSEIAEYIKNLEFHQLLLLKSLISLYKKQGADLFPMGVVEKEYEEVAKGVGIEPRRHTQVYEYIKRLKLIGLITTMQSGRGIRGRSTLISLSVPPNELNQIVEEEIKKRLVS